MSKILLAWELGENWGHLARDLPVVRALCGRGHQVVGAVSDTRVAGEILGAAGIPFVQAPMAASRTRMTQPLASYAELLITRGYGERATLGGLIAAWRGLFTLFRPDVVMIDYAPTALLAARIHGIPVVLIGNGFELPPRSSPLPSLRFWEPIPKERFEHAEGLALCHINEVLVSCHSEPLAQLADVFQGEHRILTTFSELDHYGARQDGNYVGPVYEMPKAQRVEWPLGGHGSHIFAYLRPWVPGVEDLLWALQATGCSVICAFPGGSAALIQRFQTPLLRIFPMAVSLESLLPTADLVIGYGSGLVATALLRGVPLLLVPRWSEQYLTAQRVEALGAGLMMRGPPTQASYSSLIATALGTPKFRTAAQAFAKKYEGFDGAQSVTDTVACIERAIP